MAWEICTEQFHGHDVTIRVDETGEFLANLNGHWFRAATLPALRSELMHAARAATKVAVPLTAVLIEDRHGPAVVVDVVCVGITQRLGGDPIFRYADGPKQGRAVKSGHWQVFMLRRLTATQKDDLRRAHEEMRLATAHFDDLIASSAVDVRAETRRALREAVQSNNVKDGAA